MWYDTRCYLTSAQKLTKSASSTTQKEKLKSNKQISVNSPWNPWRRKSKLWWEGSEENGFKPGIKEWGGDEWWEWLVDGTTEVPLIGLGESELEWLVHSSWREAGSWFQRWGGAYRKERPVIRREDDTDERASVTKDEERVLREGWMVMMLCRYEGLVVVRTLKVSERSLYSMCSVIFNQCRDRRMEVMRLDLGALTTARAREFWICWSRVIWDFGRELQ